MNYRIFVVNPGSTSTKIALFENETKVFAYTVEYDSAELNKYPTISSQLPYRMKNIEQVLEENHVKLSPLHACVGRCGSVLPLEGGTYEVNDLMMEHSKVGINGVYHPAQLGAQIAGEFAKRFNCKVYTVNPPEVDEFDSVARITGIKGIQRESHLHALNLKKLRFIIQKKLAKHMKAAILLSAI
jgi:butyrate kinase